MIPKATCPQKAGLTEYQKEQFDCAFEMLSCNVSPGLFQIERRGKCQCRSLSSKSIKSALLVASWACQQDNCPFTAHVFRAFSQDLKMNFSIQHAPQPPKKRLKATETKTFILIIGLCPSLQVKGRDNRSFLNCPLTVIKYVCLSWSQKHNYIPLFQFLHRLTT